MIFLILLSLLVMISGNGQLYRTKVKVGVIVPVERRHLETRVQMALDIFNSNSVFLNIEPVFVFTSERDALLRLGNILVDQIILE